MEKNKEKNTKIPPFLSARFIASIVFGLLMIIGVIITLVSSANLVNMALEEYVLNINECDYEDTRYYLPEEKEKALTAEEREAIDKENKIICEDRELDNKKRSIADSVAFLLFSLPLTYLTYDRLRRLISI